MLFRRAHDPDADDATEALVDGDRTLRRGTAGAALRHRDFRLVWGGTFLSNIGTWMQNVILGVFAYKISEQDAGYVGLLYFAQLGPLLFLSQIGGVIADQVNRRRFLVTMQTMQMVLSFLLVPLAVVDHPNLTARLPLRARDRHLQRAERPGDGRDPADARAPRGPPGRGVAPVGADEPVAGHRLRDRRRALRGARHRLGLRHQRRPRTCSPSPAWCSPATTPATRTRSQGKPLEKVLSGAQHLVERPAAPAHLRHDVHVLVLLAHVRGPVPRRRLGQLRDLREPEARLRAPLRHLGAGRGARRAHRRHLPRAPLEGGDHPLVARAVRRAARRLRAARDPPRSRSSSRPRSASPTSSSSRRCRRCSRSTSTTPCAAGSWRCGS